MKKISVIIKDPGGKPRHVNISTSHQNLKKIVEGEPYEFLLAKDLVIISNAQHDGPAPLCCAVCGKKFFGTVIFCGIGHSDEEASDELIDLPIDFQAFKRLFPWLWE